MTRGKTIAIAGFAVLVVAQLIPLTRDNPPVETEAPASAELRELLRRSCYDCHSHETRWPWYAHLAPVSWLVVYDVHEAREHLNFSAWNRYDRVEQREKIEEVWEEVEEGEMPL
ncbi:MAG: heme-binding domain-containing protein, partial [Proteobacteria bacterium]|nr:heme-binding domain-containing protein [Pseudomonadota bacterium]